MNGYRELVVSLLQAVILLCFNHDQLQNQGYTILDIMTNTGIDDRGEVERILLSLSCAKESSRVLTIRHEATTAMAMATPDPTGMSATKRRKSKKTTLRKSISDQDRFFFNTDFTSKRQRISINTHLMKESTEDRTKTREAVSRDRQALTDASIVRIMKARKRLEHRTLVAEAMNQLRFSTTGTDIKKRIETLIEREYMARVAGDRTTYDYLA